MQWLNNQFVKVISVECARFIHSQSRRRISVFKLYLNSTHIKQVMVTWIVVVLVLASYMCSSVLSHLLNGRQRAWDHLDRFCLVLHCLLCKQMLTFITNLVLIEANGTMGKNITEVEELTRSDFSFVNISLKSHWPALTKK